MLAPDSNDVFDKLRHAVAVSGSGLPIHKGDEPPEPPEPAPPPMPYDESGVFDIAAIQSSLGESISRLEAEAEARAEADAQAVPMESPPSAKADAKADAGADLLHHPVLNPVLPRDFMSHYSDFDEPEERGMPKKAVVGLIVVALLIGGGALLASKQGWMPLSAVHIASGKGSLTNGSNTGQGGGIVKIMAPPPPGGPTIEDIQNAAALAVTSRFASNSVINDQKAVLNSLRVIARQPTPNASSWEVLMTLTVRHQPAGAAQRAIERKEGYPEHGQSAVIEVPMNAGTEGAPPAVPFISAPIPPPPPAQDANNDDGKEKGVRRIGPPAMPEPQPRWVSIDWSGERWFIGDYEFE